MRVGGGADEEVERLIRELERIDSEFRAASRTYSRDHADRIKERLREDRRAVQEGLERVRLTGDPGPQRISSTPVWVQEVRNAAAVVSAADQTLKLRGRGREAALARGARDRALDRLEELLSDHSFAGVDLEELLEHY